MPDYPDSICHDCGSPHLRPGQGRVSSWSPGICGWCGEEKPVTEPRDYRYPPAPKGGSDAA